MILCIYGPSLTGKTTLASSVAQSLNLPVRYCGHEARKRMQLLELSLDDMQDTVHRQIDRETIDWALAHEPCVVEGRFLDGVFSEVHNQHVYLLLLSATHECRLGRGRARAKERLLTFAEQDLNKEDRSDLEFRRRIFSTKPASPHLTIDTSLTSLDECTQTILNIVKKSIVIIPGCA